ncbi:MAG: copper chaperone PCu(A)C [Pseudomonadota bacterium]
MKTCSHLAAAFALLALAGCGSDPDAAGSAGAEAAAGALAGAPVTVEGAYVQEPAAGRTMTSGGVTLVAVGDDLRLVAASSALAERIELHTMFREDGMMRMEQIEAVDLPAGEPVTLKRGADHLMLFGIEPLEPGSAFPLELTVEDGEGASYSVDVQATVRQLGE